MININEFSDKVFKTLQDFVEVKADKNLTQNAIVRKKVIQTEFPLIIFENRSNTQGYVTKDNYGVERARNLSFEINIYASDINSEQISGIQICENLENIVTYVMQYVYRMQGGTDAKIYNVNGSKITQFVLHFRCEWFINKNIIY